MKNFYFGMMNRENGETRKEKAHVDKSRGTSPFGLIGSLILIIFLAEFLIMVLLVWAPPLPQYIWPIFDAILLTLLVIPGLYVLIYRPLVKEIIERRRVEKEFFESNAKLGAVFQSSGVGIRAIDLEFGIIDQNKEMDLLSGIEKDGAIGQKCFKSFRDPRCGTDECTLKQILSGKERVEIEAERHAENGKIVPVSLIATPLRDKEGKIVGVIESFRDITERKKAEEVLLESEEKYRNLAERANDGITIVQDTLLKYVNPRLAKIIGYTIKELTNTPFTNYIHPDELPKVADRYKRRMAGEDVPQVYETAIMYRDGSKIDVEFNAGIIMYQEKPADLVFVRDITERKKAEEKKEWLTKKLKRQAQIDGLTKVLNRQHLDGELKLEIQRARRYNRSLSLIMLDIDHFKEVNDSCGHRIGDQVLKKIAKDIKDIIRTTDFVGRYGGEEFLVVCPETGLDEAINLAKRMQEKIRELQVMDKESLSVKITASFGVGQYSEPENFDKLVIKVDDALYKAKNAGRNRIFSAVD